MTSDLFFKKCSLPDKLTTGLGHHVVEALHAGSHGHHLNHLVLKYDVKEGKTTLSTQPGRPQSSTRSQSTGQTFPGRKEDIDCRYG